MIHSDANGYLNAQVAEQVADSEHAGASSIRGRKQSTSTNNAMKRENVGSVTVHANALQSPRTGSKGQFNGIPATLGLCESKDNHISCYYTPAIDRNSRQRATVAASGKDALRALLRFPRVTNSRTAPTGGQNSGANSERRRQSACVFDGPSSSGIQTGARFAGSVDGVEEYSVNSARSRIVLEHIAYGTTITSLRRTAGISPTKATSTAGTQPGKVTGADKMLTRGPRGSELTPELVGKIEARKEIISPISKRNSAGGIDQFHTLQIKRSKSDEDLETNTLPRPSPTHQATSPGKSRFRRRSQTNTATMKSNKSGGGGGGLEISIPVPGSFRKVAGVREDKTDGGGGGERLRMVEIDLSGDKRQHLEFDFDLRKLPTQGKHEAKVTHVEPDSVVDAQHLLEAGDILVKVNGMDTSTIGNKEDMKFLMCSKPILTLSIRPAKSIAVNNVQRPSTADGFFTTPEPPGKKAEAPASPPDPLRVNTIEKFVPDEIDPEDMECAYDAIELYPEKKDPRKSGGTQATADDEDLDWGHYRSRRDSVGLLECMEGVVDVLLSKDLTGQERREQLNKHLGMEVALPSLTEEADDPADTSSSGTVEPRVRTPVNLSSHHAASTVDDSSRSNADKKGQLERAFDSAAAAAEDDSDCTTDGEVEAIKEGRERTGELSASSRSLAGSQDDSEVYPGDTNDNGHITHSSELSASSRARMDSLHSLSGVLYLSVFDGAGFIPSSSLRCVIDADTHASIDTSRATSKADGRVSWDECFQIDLHDCRTLVISCFASTGGHRDALSGRTTVQLEALFRVAGTRRLQLNLAPKGSLRLDMSFTEQVRLLKRFPSDDQYFGVFGIDLNELISRERKLVPCVVSKCVDEINSRGLSSPSIYRAAGSFKMKETLQDSFEADSSTALLSEQDIPDVTIIAALLKDFLQDLPEPLLTNQFCIDLVKAARRTANDDVRQERLFEILQQLPSANLNMARLLFRHFHRLLEMSSANRLTSRSLSVSVGPALLCPAPHARGTAMEAIDFEGMSDVVEAMLEFGWPDSAYTNEETTF